MGNRFRIGLILSFFIRPPSLFDRAHDGLAVAIGGVCREGVENGEFRDLDPRHASRLVYTLMMSVSSGLLRSPEAKREFQDVADTLLSLIFDGLAVRSA